MRTQRSSVTETHQTNRRTAGVRSHTAAWKLGSKDLTSVVDLERLYDGVLA